jgi:hypothetical protein
LLDFAKNTSTYSRIRYGVCACSVLLIFCPAVGDLHYLNICDALIDTAARRILSISWLRSTLVRVIKEKINRLVFFLHQNHQTFSVTRCAYSTNGTLSLSLSLCLSRVVARGWLQFWQNSVPRRGCGLNLSTNTTRINNANRHYSIHFIVHRKFLMSIPWNTLRK